MLHLRGWSYVGGLSPTGSNPRRGRSGAVNSAAGDGSAVFGATTQHGWHPWSAPLSPAWQLPRTTVPLICAVLVVVLGWQLARLPAASAEEEARLAQGFAFQQQPLNDAVTHRTVRTVAPAYQRIEHWISSVGAAVALTDLDGNGRADDTCLVDPRDDSVTLRPAPATGDRFPTVRLTPAGLPYDATMAPMGCVPGDYNEDGRTDALVYYWGRSPVLFLRTPAALRDQKAGTPFVAQELVSPYEVWSTNAVSIADIDVDGHTDIVVGNYFPDGARVLDPTARQPELQMQRSMSAAFNGGTDRILLFRSGRGGATPAARFDPVPQPFSANVARGWTLAIGAQDLDGDGRPELYFGNDFGPDRLLRNLSQPGHVELQLAHGVRHPTTPKSKVLGNDSFKGMGVAFTDLNRDTVPDMVVSNIGAQYGLLESNFAWLSTRRPILTADGTANYDDHSESLGMARSGWGWDIKAGDFAGTGDQQIVQATGFITGSTNRWADLQELAMANDEVLSNPRNWPEFHPGDDLSGSDPNPFFVRGPSGRFHDIAQQIGVADPGTSRGIALADIDHDGRLDFAVANQWRQSFLYRNTRPTERPYLGLRLLRTTGTEATTTAIGAAVHLRSGASGIRTGQVYPANGHGGVSAPDLLFGLADRNAAVPVEVTWRDERGVRQSADIGLRPGWHTLLLGSDGSIQEVTR
jgi:hypothetical protein